MDRISQRELRNDSGEVLRRVEAGERLVVTRRGVPVADLVPHARRPELRVIRPATQRPSFVDWPRITIDQSTAEILDDLRGDR